MIASPLTLVASERGVEPQRAPPQKASLLLVTAVNEVW
jgi:hypothetical protein